MAARDWGGGGETVGGVRRGSRITVDGHRISFWGDKNVLKWIVVMDAQLCDYTKNH